MFQYFKKDGTPDMRYKCNREAAGLYSGGHHTTISGALDMRYSENRSSRYNDLDSDPICGILKSSLSSIFSSNNQTSSSSKNQTNVTSSKKQTNVTSSKNRTNVTSSKNRTNTTSSKNRTNVTSSKNRTNTTSSKNQTNVSSSKKQTNSTSSKKQTNSTSSKKQTNSTSSKNQTNTTSSKNQTNVSSSKNQTNKVETENGKVRKYDSSDFHFNQDGSISKASKAVKSKDILFNEDGTVDSASPAVLRGNLILTIDGNPDRRVHQIEIPINPGLYPTSVYRQKSYQQKFRRKNNVPKDNDACHVIDLEVVQAILKSKPGPHPTEEQLREDLKPINELLESRPASVNRSNPNNPNNDRDMAQRIIGLVEGDSTIKVTRGLRRKLIQMKKALRSIPPEKRNGTIRYISNKIESIIPKFK